MSSSTESKIAMAKTVVSTIGSVAAASVVARSVAREYLPSEFQDYLYFGLRNFINKLSRQLTMVIYEFDGFQENEIYNATQLYLGSRISLQTNRLKITKNPSDKNINVAMEINDEFIDTYNGVKFKWSLVSKKLPTREYQNYDDMNGSSSRTDQRSLELTFHRKHKDLALNDYLPFIINDAKTRKQEEKTVKLFTLESYQRQVWTSVNLDHPATFATLAMETDVKEKVMKDLDRFVERREYYRKVGKAWKRGYLLYGPPGTGKSSLIAAMANYLNFDIYDLELTDIRSNSDLRRLLVATANRSILVVEDIDCSVELHDRVDAEPAQSLVGKYNHRRRGPRGYHEEQRVTLSGFLNFIDGLWSSCGDERIIIFTTNRKDILDPALLRPGRMDVHINMSYCTPSGLRLLASNYLGITQHSLFEQIEDLIGEVEVTPAEIAEQLLKDDDPDIALSGLVEFFDVKRKENEEAKEKGKKQEELAAKESEQIEKNETVPESFS
ncbi:hypothetical protein L1987_34150 [Smallanthus sonchifolius]|uniref:Uncharacterized protein n=1 Tax=Smallanthus sonchifolius TaxID=185202 RepID=A0ACB9HUI7_9ASTR|nr:hypothetical protein L1987_34150 [Smallanthus sonchifolius]